MISFVVGYLLLCFIALGVGVAVSVFVDGKLLVKDLVYMLMCSATPILNIVMVLLGIVVVCAHIPCVKKLVELMDKEVYKR